MINMEEYKKIIIKMIRDMDESDSLFLKQIYTLVKKHIEKKGRH